MSKDQEELNEVSSKPKIKRTTLVLFAIVIGIIALAAIFVTRTFRTPPSSSNSQAFQPDRNYSQGGDFSLLNSAILAGTEEFWTREFNKSGQKYRPPTVVLFNGTISSVCGFVKNASGSFYCPKDERIYIDLTVTRELINRLGMDGNFAQAYVLTHLVGHHIQKLLGGTEATPGLNADAKEFNSSNTVGLQADLYSGIMFAHYQQLRAFGEQDIEKWLTTVSETSGSLCKTQECVVPDPFTHGSIQQRLEWFNRGLKMSSSEKTDFLKEKPLALK
jgi:uncharacterized protein